VLSSKGKSGHLSAVSDLIGKAFTLSPLSMMLLVDFELMLCINVEEVSFYS
jgi:hypothetical protein